MADEQDPKTAPEEKPEGTEPEAKLDGKALLVDCDSGLEMSGAGPIESRTGEVPSKHVKASASPLLSAVVVEAVQHLLVLRALPAERHREGDRQGRKGRKVDTCEPRPRQRACGRSD